MLSIDYNISDNEQRELSKEAMHAKILYARAADIKAIFGLLSLVNVEEHYLSCDTIEPHEDLSRILRGIGELGARITDGMCNEIDQLESICEDVTTFTEPLPKHLK